MPTYTFRNPEGLTTTKRLSFQEFGDLRAGKLTVSDEQGRPLELVFDPGNIGFVMKDGESGGWASRALKERRLRAERGKVMRRREQDHVFKNRLIPNYGGQEAPSWRDAQEAARSAKGRDSADTYNDLVKKELKR